MAEFPNHPFLLSVEETAQALATDVDRGLTSAQVAELQQKYPKNELDVGEGIPWYKLLTKQILNAMIIVSPVDPRGPRRAVSAADQWTNTNRAGPGVRHGAQLWHQRLH